MSAEQTPDDDTRTPWPFIAAVAVIGLIVAGIVIAGLLSPADENVSDSQRVQTAVTNFVAAHNKNDEPQLRAATCAEFDAAKSPLPQRSGEVSVDRVEAAVVDGDRATAEVTTKHDDATDPVTNWKFTRTDGEWRVCS